MKAGSSENSKLSNHSESRKEGGTSFAIFPDLLTLGLPFMTQFRGKLMDFSAEPGIRAQIAGFGVVPTACPQGDIWPSDFVTSARPNPSLDKR